MNKVIPLLRSAKNTKISRLEETNKQNTLASKIGTGASTLARVGAGFYIQNK
jgi:hypothetical protein